MQLDCTSPEAWCSRRAQRTKRVGDNVSDGCIPAFGAAGFCRILFMSLKLIFRRMLPLMLPLMPLSGLILPLSPFSALILSVLGLTMGGLAWVLAPALKLRSSRKFSLSAANLTSALSKSKSPRKLPSCAFPPGGGLGRMVALLLLLLVFTSSSSSVLIEDLESRLLELWREWRAFGLAGGVAIESLL